MFLVLVTLLAMASAAPQGLLDISEVRPTLHLTRSGMKEYLNIYANPRLLGFTIDSFYIKYMPDLWTTEEKDGHYIMSMTLTGYDKKDIEVSAKRGLMLMKAVHKKEDRIVKSEWAIALLPVKVDPAGRWSYDGQTIKVEFPLPRNAPENDIWAYVGNESSPVALLTVDATNPQQQISF